MQCVQECVLDEHATNDSKFYYPYALFRKVTSSLDSMEEGKGKEGVFISSLSYSSPPISTCISMICSKHMSTSTPSEG